MAQRLQSNASEDVCWLHWLTTIFFFLALDTDPGDVKARFRRAQAFQKLDRLDQAFLDAQRCAQLEPKNKAFQELLRQLGAQIQQKVVKMS